MILCFACFRDFFPLILCWIDSSRIVGASMEQYNRTRWCGLELAGRQQIEYFNVLNHSVKIQVNILFVIVTILLHLESRIPKHPNMIRPTTLQYMSPTDDHHVGVGTYMFL